MIKIEKIETCGWEASLRGMRNAMNSWHLSDSSYLDNGVVIGPNDMNLCLRLIKAGASHRKFLRMIHVQMDVTAPLYWWKDYDTYKVSTVANSCSTMHKLHSRDLTLDDFAHDQMDKCALNLLKITIDSINVYRKAFVDSGMKDKQAWYCMIQLLPTSYLQKRTLDLNYETILSIIHDRRNHKLNEFIDLCVELLTNLPYLSEFYEATK